MAESIIRDPLVYKVKDCFSAFKLLPQKVIAEGMCGQIVLAISLDKKDVKRVVKRFALSEGESSVRSKKLFYAEVMFMQSFEHNYLMKCLNAAECPEYLAISMHHYQRGTLDRYVGGLSIQRSELYATQIACALRYMHNNKVVHLDVKLDNIFMDNDYNAILGDFGLSLKLLPEQKLLPRNQCGGTFGYVAPERQNMTGRNMDPYKLDSFCLGVVLWSLVVEKKPATNIDYYLDVTGRQDLPLGIRKWLLNLLERNPSKRLTVTDMLFIIRQESAFRYVIDRF